MFYWLALIPFLVAFLIIYLTPVPSGDLKNVEDSQADALAFRMAVQHDAAVKYLADKVATDTQLVDGFRFDCSADAACFLDSYLPPNFTSDFQNIMTLAICSEVKCSESSRISIVTTTDDAAIKWTGTYDVHMLAEYLEGYSGSFPMWRKLSELPYYDKFDLRGPMPLTLSGMVYPGKVTPTEIYMEKKANENEVLAPEIAALLTYGDAAIVTTAHVFPAVTPEEVVSNCAAKGVTTSPIVPVATSYITTNPQKGNTGVLAGTDTIINRTWRATCTGKFDIIVAGGGASNSSGGPTALGGAVRISEVQLWEGNVLSIRIIAGARAYGSDAAKEGCACKGTRCGVENAWAGFGTALYIGDELIAAAGGAGFPSYGGGGYVGGLAENGDSNKGSCNGYSIGGVRGSSKSWSGGDGFANTITNWPESMTGRDTWEDNGTGYGGKSYCNISAGTCDYQKGDLVDNNPNLHIQNNNEDKPIVTLTWTGR